MFRKAFSMASILLPMAVAGPAIAANVSLILPRLENAYVGSNGPITVSGGSLSSTTSIVGGNGESSSSIAGGYLKARTYATPSLPNGSFELSFELGVFNSSLFESIILPPGAISFSIDGNFLRQRGLFADGTLFTSARASIIVDGPGSYADRFQGNLLYRGVTNTYDSSDLTTFDTASNTINADVQSTLASDNFSVTFSNELSIVMGPRDQIDISAEIRVETYMSLIGSPIGFYSLMDLGNTAQLDLRLPSNAFISNAPAGLTWVSVVPELSSTAMYALGITLLIGVSRIRKTRFSRTAGEA
jgi:hypothetical protein